MEPSRAGSREFSQDKLLHALGNALDLRDDETAGHSARIVRYCCEIGRVVGCPEEQLAEMARGAYLHDIGKIAIPDAILRKPGKLTAEEFEVMKTHTWIGFDILSGVPGFTSVAEIVLAHHERWDGGGYPRRLIGTRVPMGARIFAVADTLDAMTNDRPYRKAFPFAAARDEITRESGKQFDPEIVRAFLSIPEDEMCEIILNEKRRSLRVPLKAKVTCRANSMARIAYAVNIGEGGILLGHGLGLDIGTELEMELSILPEEGPLTVKGRIVRKELPDRIAVAFRGIHSVALEAIREYVGERVQA